MQICSALLIASLRAAILRVVWRTVEEYNVQHSLLGASSQDCKAQRPYSNNPQLLDSVQALCQR